MDIKNLKEVVVAGCKGWDAYAQAKKDGKIDASDILYLIPIAQAVGPALEDINLIPAEALDIDKAEVVDLVQTVLKEVPSLKNAEEAMARIVAVMNLLLAAKDCYLAFQGKAPKLSLSGADPVWALAEVKRAQLAAKPRAEEAVAAAPQAAPVDGASADHPV